MTVAIAWFRRDLRLDDNRALAAALAAADQVVPLFVRDPAVLGGPRLGPRRRERLDAALVALDQALRARGGRLVVRTGRPEVVLAGVAHETGARAVHAHRDVTPYARARDEAVRAALGPGVALVLHPGQLLVEPEALGDRRVFTPFHRAWLAALDPAPPLGIPSRVRVPDGIGSEPLPGVAPRGEAEAMARVAAFAARAGRYAAERDRLDLDATSRLSADLHFGTVSARRVASTIPEPAFLRQLAWRDWAAHVAWWRPESLREAWRPDMRDIPWDEDARLLAAWKDGRTGYPSVDAAMRQLGTEGWIPNRARMIAASFLAKDLFLDWRLGEAHFLESLEDGDVANNAMGWQWTAGVGTDAAPYMRVLNPVLQGERFDPHGAWIRRWVPELRGVPDAFVHRPWDAPAGYPAAYPARIVDHAEARARALARFRSRRHGGEPPGESVTGEVRQ